jgi:hypothetical protein
VKFFDVKWSGTLNMNNSYDIYRPFLNSPSWENSSIIRLLPSPIEDVELRKCMTELKRFQTVSLILQTDETSLSTAQQMFTWLSGLYLATACKLLPELTTKRLNRLVESATVKIQRNAEHLLTIEEAEAMTPFSSPLMMVTKKMMLM